MAERLLLDATSKPKSTYSEWTKGYRQSENVIDQREPRFQAEALMNYPRTPNKTRKVDADEAVRITSEERSY